MFYLCLSFLFAWACHLIYLLAIDHQIRQITRRMQVRNETAPLPGDH